MFRIKHWAVPGLSLSVRQRHGLKSSLCWAQFPF